MKRRTLKFVLACAFICAGAARAQSPDARALGIPMAALEQGAVAAARA